MKRSKVLDQFYTQPKVAMHCLAVLERVVPEASRAVYLEPSAGSGSFSSLRENMIAIDIDPKIKEIEKKNFLKTSIKLIKGWNPDQVATIGNPPFGRRSSFAVRFFNHAATMSNTIAFIVPKTFRKASIQNQLNLNFWLIHDEDVPARSFIHNEKTHDTPCCFQIWIRKPESRVKVSRRGLSDHFVLSTKNNCDFAIRRVGGRSGRAISDVASCGETSHYFIKLKGDIDKDVAIEKINRIDFSSHANSTAGIRSISQKELFEEINKVLSS